MRNDRLKFKSELIGVVGAGSWGTSLATLLSSNGHDVVLWCYENELVADLDLHRQNKKYLPDIYLDEKIRFTNKLEDVFSLPYVLLVSPTQFSRKIIESGVDFIQKNSTIISASKGIEQNTLSTMSDVVRNIIPDSLSASYAVLSGPTFAMEVAQGKPSAVVVASKNIEKASILQAIFSNSNFRVYTNCDVIGVELAGALKNVIALAAGISDGLGYGFNARAALITRGLAEIRRLGLRCGALNHTFAGLAGMGDLVLTCTGELSRNRYVGIKLGQGMILSDILAEMSMVAEGVKTTLSAYLLARKYNVEVPIIEQMYMILNQGKKPQDAVQELMKRELRSEDNSDCFL
ncbi:NAD(P)H-dependent glycerol-3-phosphate dehydrogenase [Desulfuromonas thiophila]|uniref:Glycerol-3-phosphate dehydrogenase [NAD(P)+] n=1 Tax=Desulfuromonas thiophila TaxID=57664 RepID=A0A1G7E6L1_9BACT|nr:NAD(P)H-dependent glycerol-3-phosphate dehydrogenase [Desulfuromonas thiophila]SDE59249.1 glycerol 3-phosphate dehydrogenase (NAD(P)+) [Desulfuromonas thiophila]